MLKELKADVARYPGGLVMALRSPGFYPVAVYRLGSDVYRTWPRGAALVGKLFYKAAAAVTGLATGIAIEPAAEIGPGLYIGHWGCIHIGRDVRIGENCNLSPMVIIGFGAIGGSTAFRAGMIHEAMAAIVDGL